MLNTHKRIAVIGGGAAGFFFAVNCAEKNPNYRITIFEKSAKLLDKVRISGGGRCNVTHACFDEKELTKFYPRGERELLGAFHHFYTENTIAWFEARGVKLKTEADGRMFPISDNSETIIHCLLREAEKHQVEIRTQCGIDEFVREEDKWSLKMRCIEPAEMSKGEVLQFDAVFIATGSAHGMWDSLKKAGHTIIPAVPSLFTFNIKDERIKNLMGISVKHATVSVVGQKLQAKGPLLITHWGLSGPAVLRLSAWGARVLNEIAYKFSVQVNWCGERSFAEVLEFLKQHKIKSPKKTSTNDTQFEIPLRLWQSLADSAGITAQDIWANCSNKLLENLAKELTQCVFSVSGKSTNKDEFVTAGGVDLKEVDFRTMQSKLLPNLYFGGEVLNIDALTGGFNFQAAWTGAWIASESV